MPLTSTAAKTAGALGALGLGAGAAAHIWARHIEIHQYTLRELELRILPPGARTIRVLHISDIHLMPDQDRKLAFLEHLGMLQPHLVINTGDNISSAASVPVLAEVLAPLLRRPGAFVLGSNDMFAPGPKNPARYLLPDPRPEGMTEPRELTLPTEELVGRLSEHGWKDLTNTRASIELGGLEVRLVGVDDPHLERDEMPAATSPAAPLPEHGNVLRLGSRTRPTSGSWTPSSPTART
ncbi:metallophosphoesterase [Brachybacterium sp. Z12]|uniref:metallophosphoesterase n=1 Tax=Brachybacterium sp. Z12 TaxID=2759167 RepID=UPI00223A867A|nr:metallophosphoesterase [Brachybacterium sp. Z12]